MATVRKNQAQLTPAEWRTFIDAINALRGIGQPSPRYGTFVDVHVRDMSMAGMSWGVHTMPRMGAVGRNFLTWFRRYILRLEQRLQKVKPNAFLPYWRPIANPAVPEPLNTRAFI
jgi:hypothetical protein